jgi:Ca2+:H+ antiporter
LTTAGPVYSAAPLGFVPAVAAAAYALDKRLVLAPPQSLVLLFLTFALSMLTFGAGRTNVLFGLVHMVVFAVFLFGLVHMVVFAVFLFMLFIP